MENENKRGRYRRRRYNHLPTSRYLSDSGRSWLHKYRHGSNCAASNDFSKFQSLSYNQQSVVKKYCFQGLVNTVFRQKPGALTLANKAIKSIWSNPTSIFITVKARDILFDGVIIHCGVSDFAGKAICSNLRAEPSLKILDENDLAFSLLGPVSKFLKMFCVKCINLFFFRKTALQANVLKLSGEPKIFIT